MLSRICIVPFPGELLQHQRGAPVLKVAPSELVVDDPPIRDPKAQAIDVELLRGLVVVDAIAIGSVVEAGVAVASHQEKDSTPTRTPPASTIRNLIPGVATACKRLNPAGRYPLLAARRIPTRRIRVSATGRAWFALLEGW